MGTNKHGKSTKAGRNKKSGQNLAYFNESRHVKGHIRRIKKQIAAGPNDKCATAALDRYTAKLGSKFA